jgi:hypothetical protein
MPAHKPSRAVLGREPELVSLAELLSAARRGDGGWAFGLAASRPGAWRSPARLSRSGSRRSRDAATAAPASANIRIFPDAGYGSRRDYILVRGGDTRELGAEVTQAAFHLRAGWGPPGRHDRASVCARLSGPFRKYDDIRAASGGAQLRPRTSMWQGHTFGPASSPGIHRRPLSVSPYLRNEPLRLSNRRRPSCSTTSYRHRSTRRRRRSSSRRW